LLLQAKGQISSNIWHYNRWVIVTITHEGNLFILLIADRIESKLQFW
jgi:hypothetical protein